MLRADLLKERQKILPGLLKKKSNDEIFKLNLESLENQKRMFVLSQLVEDKNGHIDTSNLNEVLCPNYKLNQFGYYYVDKCERIECQNCKFNYILDIYLRKEEQK